MRFNYTDFLIARSLMVSEYEFPVQVQLLAMCRGEPSAVIARLLSKCLSSGWKWYWGVKEISSPFLAIL